MRMHTCVFPPAISPVFYYLTRTKIKGDEQNDNVAELQHRPPYIGSFAQTKKLLQGKSCAGLSSGDNYCCGGELGLKTSPDYDSLRDDLPST